MAQFSCGTNATFTPTASTTNLPMAALLCRLLAISPKSRCSTAEARYFLVGYITFGRGSPPLQLERNQRLITSTSPGITPVKRLTRCPTPHAPIHVADNKSFQAKLNVQGGGALLFCQSAESG